MPAGDRNKVAVAIKFKRFDRRTKWTNDQLVGAGKTLAIGKRGAIVDHGHVEPKHRTELRERLSDMTRTGNYQPLRPAYRIEEHPWRAARLNARGRIQHPVGPDLEQRRLRVRCSLVQLSARSRSKSRKAVWRRCAPRDLDNGAFADLDSRRPSRIDDREQG